MKLLNFQKKKDRYNNILKQINITNEEVLKLKYIFLPALSTHHNIFFPFKNIYHNKKVVLLGSGPSFNNYVKIQDAIHIGVNHTFLNNKVNLDYLFIQDNLGALQKEANLYLPDTCIKFYGNHYIVPAPTEQDAIKANAKRYYFNDQTIPTSQLAMFSNDITTRPLNTWSSVIFPALEFALWTAPKEIYIVGCDCSENGNFSDKNYTLPHIDRILYGWEQMKIFAFKHYPTTKIISINPKGLKNMFDEIEYH